MINTPQAWSARAAAPTSHEAALWSEEGQRKRFAAVIEALAPQPGEWLLDFGCGTGLFSTYVREGVNYFGYDWSDGMVERAKRDHPAHTFVSTLSMIDFDVVACIGCFNLGDNWSRKQTWDTLTDLWANTNRALAVCLYSGGHDDDCISYLDSECIEFCETLDAKWTVERHLQNDLLLVLKR
jgi:SAM-dependent methyltransferase